MSSQIQGKFIRWQIMPLFLSGLLTLIGSGSPVQGQINKNDTELMAQVLENLPPPPNIQPMQPTEFNQYNQNYDPNFQPSQSLEFNQFNQNPQPYQPSQFNQYNNAGFERYLVYVDGNSYQTLQTVRRVERTAYIRQYRGRSVIQAGIFSRQSNAQLRVRELESLGIYGARVSNFNNGEEIPNSPGGGGNYGSDKSLYYVVIPAKPEDLPSIANRIRQNVGQQYGFVRERTKPLGTHVAVGPFNQRIQAEQWNNYLRNIGYGNARVYYGR